MLDFFDSSKKQFKMPEVQTIQISQTVTVCEKKREKRKRAACKKKWSKSCSTLEPLCFVCSVLFFFFAFFLALSSFSLQSSISDDSAVELGGTLLTGNGNGKGHLHAGITKYISPLTAVFVKVNHTRERRNEGRTWQGEKRGCRRRWKKRRGEGRKSKNKQANWE